jgi:hypothetical protein
MSGSRENEEIASKVKEALFEFMKLKWLPRNSSALSKCGDTFLQSWN